jgi:MoxR-like ATPase
MTLPVSDHRSITAAIDGLKDAVCSVVRGKEEVVELALTAVLAGGHLLLQDVPGVGKTTLAASLASALGGSFSRVQFTSDLLPGDITGVNVLDRNTGSFEFQPGPIFANVVLADEINRTSPRTQSALFECMEEGQVTVDGCSRPLPTPFFVVATQNPFDHHGTYQLPDSQLDRFVMRLSMGYPDRDAEREVMQQRRVKQYPDPVASNDQIMALCDAVEETAVPNEVSEYILDLVRRTRTDSRLLRGVSTRGGQALFRAVRAYAVVRGRTFSIPEDVHILAVPVLAHRVLPRIHSEDGGGRVIAAILEELASPV